MEPSTFDRVKAIVTDILAYNKEGFGDLVTKDAAIIDDLGADSLDCMELLMGMEEEFGHEISDDEAESCLLVGDIVKLIDRKAA